MDDMDVAIIGQSQFNNKLLQDFIENRLNLRCGCKNTHDISSLLSSRPKNKLLIWDCLSLTPDEIRAKFKACLSSNLEQCKVVFLNLSPVDDLESEALALGVKGIFYLTDTPGNFEKGIQAVLNDELWFSRAIISKYLNNSQQLAKNLAGDKPASLLTSREKQILLMIVAGSNNRKIAETLCISPHTVKTHLNNIFGKIMVSDRVQALLWAVKNL